MARLILDTCVLIAGVRGRVDLAGLADTNDVVVPDVTARLITGGAQSGCRTQ